MSSGGADDREARIERQLAAAQQITHLGSWEWDAATGVVTWSDELYRIYGLEPRSREITFDYFLSRLHPDDRDRIRGEVGAALASGGRFAYPERIVRPDGSIRHLDTIGEAVRGADGEVVGLIGTCRDVTEETRARQLESAEQRVLEMIASGAPLPGILDAIVRMIEAHAPPTIASILLLDPTGTRVMHGAAPGLPAEYNRAIDGAAIGPRAGSCGTAAFTRRQVIVTDIETDPLWEGYRELARPYGLRACWSTPILSNDGRVLGTFALYYETPRAPTEADLALIPRATHLAGIAIERRQLEDQLRALSEHAEAIREEERTGIAREIHDELGQALTAIKIDLSWIARRAREKSQVPSAMLLDKVKTMTELTDDVIQRVRRISTELRPGVLDDLGLVAALEWQAGELTRRTGIACTIHGPLADTPLARPLATAVFRVFQEALTNVARHADARRVDVTLERTPEGALVLIVDDDGKGIAAEAVTRPSSLGLLGMRERIRRLGGRLEIAPLPEKGTRVSLVVPAKGATP